MGKINWNKYLELNRKIKIIKAKFNLSEYLFDIKKYFKMIDLRNQEINYFFESTEYSQWIFDMVEQYNVVDDEAGQYMQKVIEDLFDVLYLFYDYLKINAVFKENSYFYENYKIFEINNQKYIIRQMRGQGTCTQVFKFYEQYINEID